MKPRKSNLGIVPDAKQVATRLGRLLREAAILRKQLRLSRATKAEVLRNDQEGRGNNGN